MGAWGVWRDAWGVGREAQGAAMAVADAVAAAATILLVCGRYFDERPLCNVVDLQRQSLGVAG